jgi:hypothetical protein
MTRNFRAGFHIMALLVGVVCVANTSADVRVYVWDSSSGATRPSTPKTTVASGADISIVLGNDEDSIQLIGTSETTDIGHVDVVGPAGQTEDLVFMIAGASIGSMPDRRANVEPGCRHWSGVHFHDIEGVANNTRDRSYVGAW